MIGPILRRAEAGRTPSRREVLLMLRAEENEYLSLLEVAGRICRQQKGDGPSMRALVDLHDGCDAGRALDDAIRAWRQGCTSVLLRAACRVGTAEEVSELVRAVCARTDLKVALCMGERPYDVYAAWRQAGAEEYMLPHECCNPRLYARIHPGHSPAERLARYLWLRGLGFRVTGGICVGLEGQSMEDLADDLEVLRNAGVTGVVLRVADPDADVLRVLAIARLCLPQADLWLATDDAVLQARALNCGANLLIATPLDGAGLKECWSPELVTAF